jgi:hypothetical protein
MAQLALPQDDLVPLSVAASLAYCELIGVNSPLGSDEHLRDVLDLTAAALLHVAPAYRISPDGASLIRAEETEKLLFAAIREGGHREAAAFLAGGRFRPRGAGSHARTR